MSCCSSPEPTRASACSDSERVFLDDVAMDAIAAWGPAATRAGVTLVVRRCGGVTDSHGPIAGAASSRHAARERGPIHASRRENRSERSPSGDRIALAVSDTGIGIPPDELPRIFERFFRGARSRAMVPEGSGLGLPIAAWIVDQCAGTIDVVSGPDGGTLVRVSLPIDAVVPIDRRSFTRRPCFYVVAWRVSLAPRSRLRPVRARKQRPRPPRARADPPPWLPAAPAAAGPARRVPPSRDSLAKLRAVYVAQVMAQIAGRENQPAEQVFKNVQVLKGITAAELVQKMDKDYATAMSWNCTNCHRLAPQGNFASDTSNDKKRARFMQQMQNDINHTQLPKLYPKDTPAVTCATCHRGYNEPPSAEYLCRSAGSRVDCRCRRRQPRAPVGRQPNRRNASNTPSSVAIVSGNVRHRFIAVLTACQPAGGNTPRYDPPTARALRVRCCVSR